MCGQDLPRTFPANRWVAAAAGQAALRRVLLAYSVHAPGVGYCQGMNYLAAMALLALACAEEGAFWVLAAMIDDGGAPQPTPRKELSICPQARLLVLQAACGGPSTVLLQAFHACAQSGSTPLTLSLDIARFAARCSSATEDKPETSISDARLPVCRAGVTGPATACRHPVPRHLRAQPGGRAR